MSSFGIRGVSDQKLLTAKEMIVRTVPAYCTKMLNVTVIFRYIIQSERFRLKILQEIQRNKINSSATVSQELLIISGAAIMNWSLLC